MPFLLRFCAAIRDWELAAIANRKKVAIRTDSLFLGSWEVPPPEAVLGCYGFDAERGLNLIRCRVVVGLMRSGGGSGAGAGLTRCSARVLLSRGAWVPSGYRAKVLPGCGIVMLPHCRARELFGRLLVYRVVLLLSLKISNATLLKLVFRYNGRRGFVEEQARSPL